MPYYKAQFIKAFALQSYLKAEEGLIHAATNGYNYWYIDGSLCTDCIDNWNDKRIEQIKLQCIENNIQPIFHGNFKAPLASDIVTLRKTAIEYTKREIDICEKLKCALIVHGGVIVEPRTILSTKKHALNGFIESLKELQDYANIKNIPLWLENLSNYPNYRPFSYIATTKEEFLQIFEQIDIPFFFDAGHANVNSTIEIDDFFKTFYKNIIAISMSNNNGVLDQHLALENGSIDYHRFITSILETKWNGIIAFETRNIEPRKSIQSLYSILEMINTQRNRRVLIEK